MFWLGSRHKIGRQFWKPMVIAIAFTTPLEGLLTASFQVVGLSISMAEAARAVVVLLFMIWSVGGIQFPGRRQKTIEESVTA